MKKFISLFIIAATLFSCSNSEDSVVATSDLQKVVFYYSTPNERHWNIDNGLLTDITLADGTVVEKFIYDSQNRLTTDIKYSNGAVTGTDIITYQTDNTIDTINGLPYSYNAATRTYTYSYGSSFTINCQVNSNFLVENFVRTGTDAAEYHMTYSNADMTSFEKINSGSTEIIKNFHFDGLQVNPLYNTVLAVARVKSLTDPSFFVDNVASTKIPGGFDRGISDPNYYNYGYTSSTTTNPTHNIKDFSIGVEVLDSSNNPVGANYNFADYYYAFP